MRMMEICFSVYLFLLQSVSAIQSPEENDPRCSHPQTQFGDHGQLTSHEAYGTEDYPPGILCMYTIQAPTNTQLMIEINRIDIEESNGCLFDSLSIGEHDSKQPYRFCGSKVPSFPIIVASSVAVVQFQSDGGNGGAGFNLSYRSMEQPSIDPEQCGLTRPVPDASVHTRIIGGQPVGLGQWPWMVSLWLNGQFHCGATLYDREWLLTAAHCFPSDTNPTWWHAVAGDLLLDWPESQEQSVGVEKIYKHPQYEERGPYDHDVALVKLAAPMQYGFAVRKICMPDKLMTQGEHPINLEQCIAVGWGRSEKFPYGYSGAYFYSYSHRTTTVSTSNQYLHSNSTPHCQRNSIVQSISNELRHVKLQIRNLAECNATQTYRGQLFSSMLCASHANWTGDACQGDSGGPLLCQRSSDPRWYQIGVISFGKGCAIKDSPGIYSNVTSAIEWINSVTKDGHADNRSVTEVL